jgi:hypothetical protein
MPRYSILTEPIGRELAPWAGQRGGAFFGDRVGSAKIHAEHVRDRAKEVIREPALLNACCGPKASAGLPNHLQRSRNV